jgi:hypothetical protein
MSDARSQTARAWSTGVLGVVSRIVIPFALVSGWVDALVTNTDRYVDTVAPLADDHTSNG